MKVYKTEKGKNDLYESYEKLIEQWDVELEENNIVTKFGTTHIIEAGKKNEPILLLFHGVGDNSAMMWIFNAKELAEKFRIIAIDAIGGAGKSVPNEKYGKKFNQTEWITELMDKLGIEKADAAGVSYGCYLAQHLKIEMPDRIKKIVGMSGSISVEGSKSPIIRMIKVFFPEVLFPNDKNILKLIKKFTGPDFSDLIKNDELMKHWKLMLRNFNNAAMTPHSIKKFSSEEFLKIKDESLFLIGDHDKLSYYPGSLDIMDKLGMNYELIKNAGHVVNHEFPALINKKIIDYLI